MFYHFGLFTGGGSACDDSRWASPLRYPTAEAFEKDAANPRAIARNLAKTAKSAGARYTILTVYHTCGGMMVLYPTKVPEFLHKTRKDYIGPYLQEVRKAGLHPMLYLPCDCNNWNCSLLESPAVPAEVAADIKGRYEQVMFALVREIHDRYGDLVEGFWLDGTVATDRLPEHIRTVYPDAIIVGNNRDELDLPDVDYGTTECFNEAPDPDYSRPSAYRRLNAWHSTLPGRDFNEDIPTPNDWWYQGHDEEYVANASSPKPYVADPTFLVRQMVSSLGQRGMWNFALGVGPRIDGTPPPFLEPSLRAARRFLDWAGEAIFRTRGSEGTIIQPGGTYYRGQGYYSATVSLADPKTFYVLVTEAPDGVPFPIETSGAVPKSVVDLRTGAPVAYDAWQRLFLKDVDWSDIQTYGAKVFKLTF